jgi:hypothetical protein
MGFAFLKKIINTMDTIQINKFSKLHDGKKIIFCKTDYILEEFENIKNIQNDVIFITGNSDYVVDDYIFSKRPKNIRKWFAQNAMFVNDILQPIPIGIENFLPSLRDGHGVGWGDRVKIKQEVIDTHIDRVPTKFIYSNFNLNTNFSHRTQVKKICVESNFIDWEEPNLSTSEFFNTLLDYEAIVCAQGNGPGDNHRIYETLYMNRIPITFSKLMYDNLHNLFPVVLIENIDDLKNFNYLRNMIDLAKNKIWDKNLLLSSYWIDKIKKS